MDVVYAYKASDWNGTELKYSLRSLNTVDNVYILGDRPNWLSKKAVHIRMYDRTGSEFKEHNIMTKIFAACMLPELSNDFLFMNDDHFLLSAVPPLPYYYQYPLHRSIINRSGQDSYYHSLLNTYSALTRAGLPVLNYDIHCPIIYNKKKFIQVMQSYDWTIHYGYVIKSLYCNTLKVKPVMETDLKINSRLPCKDLEELIKDRKFFSVGEGATGAELETFLNYIYPKKSKYEL